MIKGLLVIIILISGTHLSSNDLMEEVRNVFGRCGRYV